MLSAIISFLRRYKLKILLKKIKNHVQIGNSNFFEMFSINLIKPIKIKNMSK